MEFIEEDKILCLKKMLNLTNDFKRFFLPTESQNAIIFLDLVLSRLLFYTISEFSHILVSSLTSPFEYTLALLLRSSRRTDGGAEASDVT